MGAESGEIGAGGRRSGVLKTLGGRLANLRRRLGQEPKGFWVACAAVALLVVCGPRAWIGSTATTPDGILGLQFAGTRSGAIGALTLLDEAGELPGTVGRGAVQTSLRFDAAFIVGYAVLLYLIMRVLAERRTQSHRDGKPRLVDRFAPFAPMVAGVFNGIEDVALAGQLQMHPPFPGVGPVASVTTVFATLKFSLLAFCLLYAIHSGFSRPGADARAAPHRPDPPEPEVDDDARQAASAAAGRARLKEHFAKFGGGVRLKPAPTAPREDSGSS